MIVFTRLDGLTRMVVRQMSRRPLRAGALVFGIGAAMGLSVMMELNRAAIDLILDGAFRIVDRSDLTVSFSDPLHEDVVFDLEAMEGVRFAEVFRSVPVTFHHRRREHLGAVSGVDQQPQLNRVVDAAFRDVAVPVDGLLLSASLAKVLGAEIGDTVVLDVREGRQPTLAVEVVGVTDALIGTPAYMQRDALNRLLLEPGRVSGAYLAVEPGSVSALLRRMKEIPELSNVSARRDIIVNFEELLDEGPGTFRYIITLFAGVIAIGVVYNGARITFGERRYDLASLRVLGFTRAEVSYLVFGEILVIVLFALPVGSLIGILLWSYISAALSTELYQIPTEIRPVCFGFAALVVLAAAVVSMGLIRRDIRQLDVVSALKARD